MNYTVVGTKPQIWLNHLNGGVRDPEIARKLEKKIFKEKEEAWKENKGETFHNGGSGLSWSHRQCGFHQRHTMLVPIHQLRLHVIISKIITDRGSTQGLEVSFYPQLVIQVLAKMYAEGYDSKRGFPELLSHHMISSESMRYPHMMFDPVNLSSWQIHSSSRPQGIWCCLFGPKQKVTPHSKPPRDVIWPQLCPVGLSGISLRSMLFKNNRDFEITV